MSSSTVYVCEVCGRSFTSRQAYGGHMTSHRGQVKPDTSFAGELVKARRELVASFRPRISELDRKIEQAERAVADLKSQRREVEAQLRKLDPDATVPGPKPKPAVAANAGRGDEAKLDATRAFLSGHKDLGEFTGGSLHREMKDANVAPLPSPEKTRELLSVLRDEGTIRAHKKVRGGGMAYVVVGNSNGDEAADDA